uniref:Alpha/beta hydrolase fold protein n=1 Tax=Marseillevirus LCMAC201 TaxID=2506605 RepID=A0A481YVX1_9VIRU|nr:MAG: alpha/beta hydrolase fold protein [Marseillevirus LCMAC201]
MKFLCALILLAILLYIFTRNSEMFKGHSRPTDDTGVPDGDPRIKQLVVNMGDHSTIVTVMHGTTDDYVILVHGYPLNQQTWLPLLEDLAVKARNGEKVPNVFTYDLRGCGYAVNVDIATNYLDSDSSNVEWSLDLFANDLYRIYKEIVGTSTDTGVQKVSIGGWAFGGCIAQEFALQYPNLIANLYLFSTFGTAISKKTSEITDLVRYISQNADISVLPLPKSHVNKLLCNWFNVEDTTICPKTTDLKNDIGTRSFVTARAILTTANSKAYLQVLKTIATLDLITRWNNTKKIGYNVYFIAPVNDIAAPPNQVLKIYTAIKQKYHGTQQPNMLTPDGKHYYCLQHPSAVMSLICSNCSA